MIKMKLLVTGWLWYIGSHTVCELLNSWNQVFVVDNLSNCSIDVKDKIFQITWKQIDFQQVDLLNKIDLEKVFVWNQFDAVIHFAWLKSVWESMQKPFLYYENNLTWTLNLLDLMWKYWVKNMIFSSSATVYTDQNTFPVKEDWFLWAINPYWYSKLIVEQMLQWLAVTWAIRSIALRYFNPIWAHSSGLIGEKPNWIPNNLLPYIMDVAAWKREKISVFGWDYETVDWSWVRDYIHVVDLAKGHLDALKFLIDNSQSSFEAINLGTWNWTSVLQMIDYTSQIIWKKLNYEIVWRRAGDLPAVYCDPSKAKDLLWWSAELSVKQAIQDSYNFTLKNLI